MRILKWAGIGVGLLALAVGAHVLYTYNYAGEFKKLTPHFKGQCRVVKGVLSSEDITIDPATGRAYISSMLRADRFASSHQKQGAIFAWDLGSDDPKLINLTAHLKMDLQPHGMGLWQGPKGELRLFVVNHPKGGGHTVEIFAVQGDRLVLLRTICGEAMHSPNDVIPVGTEQFYVTNDHGARSKWTKLLEDYMQLPWANLLYFDGNTFREVAEGLSYANGVNLSPDQGLVFVAETLGQQISVFRRDKGSGALTLVEQIPLGTGVDNIEVDESGALWVGAHPKILTFVEHAKDHRKLAPSQVLKITYRSGGGSQVEDIFLSEGKDLSASSVAAVWKDHLLIGAVFVDRFLVCRMK